MIEPGKKKTLLIYLIEILIWPVSRLFHKTTSQKGEVQKILVLELWGVGDVVLASGMLTALRQRYPNADIHMLAKGHAKALLIGHGSGAELREFSFPWTAGLTGKYQIIKWPWREIVSFLKMLRREKYDLALESRGDIRNHILMLLIDAKHITGFSFGFGWMLDSKAELPPKGLHRIEDWGAIWNVVGHDLRRMVPELHVSNSEKSDVANKLALPQGGWIGIHVAASNKSKQWPLVRFEQLVDKLNVRYPSIPIVVFIDPSGYGDDMNLPNSAVVGKGLSLRELMAAIANCRLLVALDGGPMHIGAALNVPVVALFGPTIEAWFGPVGDDHKVVVENICEHRPCYDYCRFDVPFCMEAISLGRVVREIENCLINQEQN